MSRTVAQAATTGVVARAAPSRRVARAAAALLVIGAALPAGASLAAAFPDTALPATGAMQRAAELLELHLAWRGGRRAVERIEALERRGSLVLGPTSGTLRTMATAAGFLRSDVRLDAVQQVEAVTPHGGWRWVDGALEDLDDARIGEFRASVDTMLGRHLLPAGGYDVVHLGEEAKEGVAYEALRFSKGVERFDLLIDPAVGQADWSRDDDSSGAVWTRLDDWRFVGGVRFAFRVERHPGDPDRRQLTEWEAVVPPADFDLGEFLRPAAGNARIELDGPRSWVPFRLFLDGYVELDGEVNGRAARMLVDSGAGITALDERFAVALGLSTRPAGSIRGIGGLQSVALADDVDLAIPGVRLDGATVGVLDLSEVGEMLGRDYDAILGAELFSRAIVAIDYPNRRLAVVPPGPYEPPARASSVRMYARRGVPRVSCRFEALPAALCEIDTGSNSAVNIAARYVEDHDLLAGREPLSTFATGGIGGVVETPIGTLRELAFAGVSLGPAPAYFFSESATALDGREIAGLIGADAFAAFVLVFDYPGMRFHVIREGAALPVARDRSGLQSIYRGEYLEVFFVAPGSPAAHAGFVKGERVVAIDGVGIGPGYLEDGFRWRYRAAGERVTITDGEGGRRTLTLADYF